MRFLFLNLILLLSFNVSLVQATEFSDAEKNKTSSFKSLIEVSDLDIVVPSVVEVPLNNNLLNRAEFAVFEENSESFQPYYFIRNNQSNRTNKIAYSDLNTCKMILDQDYETFCEYTVPEDGFGKLEITIEGDEAFSSSHLNLHLDKFVALPNQIEIKADGKAVYSKNDLQSSYIYFPENQARTWQISLSYNQLLRISEIDLIETNTINYKHSIRFLARPGSKYRIYLNPENYADTKIDTGESANLRNNIGVIKTQEFRQSNNPNFIESDIDGDGVVDKLDNCVNVSNSKQIDLDNNMRGDKCDDFDKDGIMNYSDNCPDKPNRYQNDRDGDGLGDVCDELESRVTEKYPWLVWFAMGFALIVITVMFVSTLRKK